MAAQVAPAEADGTVAAEHARSNPPVNSGSTTRIRGQLRDLATGRILAGATAYVPATGVGAAADSSGAFTLEVPADSSVTIRFNYLGYSAVERSIDASRPGRFDVYLEPARSTELEEVVVSARKFATDPAAVAAPVDALGVGDVRLIPGLLGEADVLQAVKLRPGVASGSESNHGLYVRGGSTDQNLVRLGGAKLYNPYHLFGFFSTFNPDAVEGVKLHKGGFPARYGGRLASVIDVGLREGSDREYSVRGGLGLLSSRLGVDGPLARGRSSFAVSARRTYVDLLTGPINRLTDDGAARGEPLPGYDFQDLNARADFSLGRRDHLTVSGYYGRDALSFESFFFDLGMAWGNTAGAATWRHSASPATTLTTTLSTSHYDYAVDNRTAGYDFALASGIGDLTLEAHVDHLLTPEHALSFGASLAAINYRIADIGVVDATGGVSFSGGDRDLAGQYALYGEDAIRLNPRLTVTPGLRLSAYVNDGASYLRPEPRLRARYAAAPRLALQASYSRMVQYAHLVSPAGLALPIDIWFPSTERTRPQTSDQVSGGASVVGSADMSLALQGFYKRLGNQVDFVDGANPFTSSDVERDFDYGRGFAYGAEVKLERHAGRLRGWLSYTYQRIRRGDFARIMDGRYFSPRYDRRHDASAVITYRLGERLQATATWVYGSGDLAWLPTGRQAVGDAPGADAKIVVPVYGDRNNYRLAPYHRADLSLVWELRPSWGDSDLTFAVYNLYDRRNAFFVYLRPERRSASFDGAHVRVPNRILPKQQSLFPILPSVTWNFSFRPGRPRGAPGNARGVRDATSTPEIPRRTPLPPSSDQ